MSTKNCAYWAHYIYLYIYQCIQQSVTLSYNILYYITTFVGLFRGQKLKEDLVTPPAPFPTAVPHVVVLKMPVRSTISVSWSMVTNSVREYKSWYMKKKWWLTHNLFLVMRLSCHLRIKQHTETQTQTNRLIPSTFSGQHFMSHIPDLSR